MEEFTYEEIRAKALKQGVKDNIHYLTHYLNYTTYVSTQRFALLYK